MRAISRRNDDPERGSRPFDGERDGFVMGEAAGNGRDRGARARAGRAARRSTPSCSATASRPTRITSPIPIRPARIPARALTMAFADAGIVPEDVGYVNAHGTSTPAGDTGETRVLKVALGEDKAYRTPISSTKGATGHCLGAAGAVEAIFTILALERGDPAADDQPDDARPDVRPRLHPERGAARAGRDRRLELVRLRRPQRLPRVPSLARERLQPLLGIRAGAARERACRATRLPAPRSAPAGRRRGSLPARGARCWRHSPGIRSSGSSRSLLPRRQP